jgi:hypothetical protein
LAARPPRASAEPGKPRGRTLELGALPVLALLAAAGVLLVALGDNSARSGAAGAQPLFWGGLILIYAPIAFRLFSASASRAERLGLVVLLSISLFVIKVLYSPIGFVFYDELGWWRATQDLLHTGHPFSSNPLVITTPGFPGLDLLTAPLVELGKLSVFDAGTLAIGTVRTAFMLALFLFFERATRSTRAAGIGVAVYVCNPSFLYFNAQFAYESAALLLGVTLLLITVRWSESDPAATGATGARSLVAAMALLAFGLVITHHMTSYAILALLIGWAVLAELDQPPGETGGSSLLNTAALPAIMLGIAASAWFAFVAGGVTITELGDQVTGSIRSVLDLVVGGSGPKKPFEAGGQSNSWLARGVAVTSVLLLVAAIPFGVKKVWRTRPKDPLQRVLALVAVLYVATLGLRLTQNGTEASQRASEFVFLGLAFLVAVLVHGLRAPKDAGRRLRSTLLFTALATVVFTGGFIVGEPPQGRQPGPFLVSAERRSISTQGLAAAEFAATELPAGSRIIVDHANAMLMGSYGGLDPVTRRIFGVPISKVFVDPTFDPRVRRLIRRGHIDYIVVDRRLSHTPPVGGYYFTREEPGAFSRSTPIPASALRKFAHVPGLVKIYSNGAIAIYDTSGIRR